MAEDNLTKVTKQFAKDIGATYLSPNINRGHVAFLNKKWTIIVETRLRHRTFHTRIKAPYHAKINYKDANEKLKSMVPNSTFGTIEEHSWGFIEVREGGDWLGKLIGSAPHLPKGIDELYLSSNKNYQYNLDYLHFLYEQFELARANLKAMNIGEPCNVPSVVPDYWMRVVGGP